MTSLQAFVDVEAISRSNNLHELTGIIHKGRSTFFEVAAALARVKDAKLYKQTHRSWESWLQDNWWGSRRHADRQIEAMKIARDLGTNNGKSGPLVQYESHARELARVDPERRLEVVKAAEDLGSGETTAADIREARELLVEGKKKPPSKQNRRTPPWFYAALNDRFGPFVLDAFSSHENALCDWHYTVVDNGFEQPWGDVTFANPEFRKMEPIVEKAVAEGKEQRRSCIVGPVGCSQDWFHEWAICGTVWVPNCRINFDDEHGNPTGGRYGEGGADRDTMVFTFGPGHWNHPQNIERGLFLVCRLEVAHLRPEGGG